MKKNEGSRQCDRERYTETEREREVTGERGLGMKTRAVERQERADCQFSFHR